MVIAIAVASLSSAGCHRQQREGTTVRASRTDPQGRQALELASHDLNCRVSVLRVTAFGDHEYRVTGCSQEASYACTRSDCVRLGSPAVSTYRTAPSAGGTWSDESVHAMLDTIHDDVLACFAAAHVPATVRVIMGRTGTISQHAITSEASADEGHCVEAVLARVRLDPTGEPAPRTVVLSFAPRALDVSP
jgi:hypothetical protein